jgi:hypothetical protein
MSKDDVWVIPEKAPSKIRKKNRESEGKVKRRGRSAAVAFSLSLLIWGGGQIYNGQKKLGFLFLLLMVNFYTVWGVIWFYRGLLASYLATHEFTPFELLAAGGLFYLCGLVFWFGNTLHAYYHFKRQPHLIDTEEPSLWPPLCSIVLPGWGQFLNGQSKKGIAFLLFTIPGLLAVSILLTIPRLWPILSRTPQHLLLEKILLVAVLVFPVFFLIWIVSVYDAGRISFDPDKKEPLLDRIKFAINRLRMKGWRRGVVPHLKALLMLLLFLTFFMSYSYYYFPKRFYADQLESLRKTLSDQGMVLIPPMIDRSLHLFSS